MCHISLNSNGVKSQATPSSLRKFLHVLFYVYLFHSVMSVSCLAGPFRLHLAQVRTIPFLRWPSVLLWGGKNHLTIALKLSLGSKSIGCEENKGGEGAVAL